jgi:hypothetical protein
MRVLTALLHLLQPGARLHGRLTHGLTPWRRSAAAPPRLSIGRSWAFWSTAWTDPAARLRKLELRLAASGARIVRGGEFDRWDVEVRVGLALRARLQMAVEEHAERAQLIRSRASFRPSTAAVAIGAPLVVLVVAAALAHAEVAGLVLGGAACGGLGWLFVEWATLAGTLAEAVAQADQAAVVIPPSQPRRLALRLHRRSAGSALPLTVADEEP